MSIKTTVFLTRREAIERVWDFMGTITGVRPMTDRELGGLLDRLAIKVAEIEGRECFDNYQVTSDGKEPSS